MGAPKRTREHDQGQKGEGNQQKKTRVENKKGSTSKSSKAQPKLAAKRAPASAATSAAIAKKNLARHLPCTAIKQLYFFCITYLTVPPVKFIELVMTGGLKCLHNELCLGFWQYYKTAIKALQERQRREQAADSHATSEREKEENLQLETPREEDMRADATKQGENEESGTEEEEEEDDKLSPTTNGFETGYDVITERKFLHSLNFCDLVLQIASKLMFVKDSSKVENRSDLHVPWEMGTANGIAEFQQCFKDGSPLAVPPPCWVELQKAFEAPIVESLSKGLGSSRAVCVALRGPHGFVGHFENQFMCNGMGAALRTFSPLHLKAWARNCFISEQVQNMASSNELVNFLIAFAFPTGNMIKAVLQNGYAKWGFAVEATDTIRTEAVSIPSGSEVAEQAKIVVSGIESLSLSCSPEAMKLQTQFCRKVHNPTIEMLVRYSSSSEVCPDPILADRIHRISTMPLDAIDVLLFRTGSRLAGHQNILRQHRLPLSRYTCGFELQQWYWDEELEEYLKLPRVQELARDAERTTAPKNIKLWQRILAMPDTKKVSRRVLIELCLLVLKKENEEN